MKNERAPRTLADATFTVGYPTVRPCDTSVHPAEWVVLAISGFCIGVPALAWAYATLFGG